MKKVSDFRKKIIVEFEEEELRFLDWAMAFLFGGPFDAVKEEQRDSMAFKVKKALADYEEGIIRVSDRCIINIECPFCDGGGVFSSEVLPSDGSETVSCPVCGGKGFNTFRSNQENLLKCKFCTGEGMVWYNSGSEIGDICHICGGTGIVNLGQDDEGQNIALWELIHPSITEVSKGRFESGHYADSVEAAFKEINIRVKEIVRSEIGEELDGAQLMHKAFSLRRPIICLGNLSTESGRNIQQGYMQIFAGAMMGIRNPKAHENLDIDPMRAIHHLTLASLLMYKLDELG